MKESKKKDFLIHEIFFSRKMKEIKKYVKFFIFFVFYYNVRLEFVEIVLIDFRIKILYTKF